MLSLVTHEPHFCLLREVVSFSGESRRAGLGARKGGGGAAAGAILPPPPTHAPARPPSLPGGNRGQPAREVLENPCQEHFVLLQIG